MIERLHGSHLNRPSRQSVGIVAAFCMFSALSACNEGGTDVATGRTGGTGATADSGTVASGTISGFGSVIVNGTRFEVNSATQIQMDDNGGASEADLRVGMIVRAEGLTQNNALIAQQIRYRSSIAGPVESACAINTPTTILGQPVIVDARTLLDGGLVCDGGATGKIVEVSGLRDSVGRIRASRVALRAPRFVAGMTLSVRGKASGVDNGAKTFRLNALTVSFAAASLIGLPASGQLAEGAMVAIQALALPVQGRLSASRLEVEAMPSGQAGKQAEVEGFVTRFVSTTDFDVSGKRVTTSNQTSFEGGAASDIALDSKIHVTGVYTADDLIAASKIELEASSAMSIEGGVTAVDVSSGRFTVLGSPGVTIKVDAGCRFMDDTGSAGPSFNLSKLHVGNLVAVTIRRQAGVIVASTLKRKSLSDDGTPVSLRGVVQSEASPELTVLGVRVDTSSTLDFGTQGGVSMSRDAFFSLIKPGETVVEVRGTFDGSRLLPRTALRLTTE